MKNKMTELVDKNHLLKKAASDARDYLDDVWTKYIDDKLHVIIQYLLFGKDAKAEGSLIESSQNWVIIINT